MSAPAAGVCNCWWGSHCAPCPRCLGYSHWNPRFGSVSYCFPCQRKYLLLTLFLLFCLSDCTCITNTVYYKVYVPWCCIEAQDKNTVQKLHKQMLGKNGQSQKTGRGITTYQEVLRIIIYLLVPFSSWAFTGDKCQGKSREEICDIWFDTLHGFHMLRYFLKLPWCGTKTHVLGFFEPARQRNTCWKSAVDILCLYID